MKVRRGGGLRLAAVFVCAALAAVSGRPAAQGGRDARPEVDPYTEGDPDAMAKAGYVRFAPFRWAADQTTEVVEDTLGGMPLLWVETEHFKIGSSLDAYEFGVDREEKEVLGEELKRLKKRIPGIKRKVKELDPWLRLHLFAMRLEELYDSFLEEFGYTDDSFPAPKGSVPYLGKGKYLGLEDKFCVLLLEKKSSMARYTGTYCGRVIDTTYRSYFQKTDTLFFGMAFESLEGMFHSDKAIHYAVVFNLIQNMSNGFRGYTHEAPMWWNIGLARWFARRADPRWLLYTASLTAGVRVDEKEAEWGRKVRARVEQDFYPSMADLMAKTSFDELDFADHMMIWSRVDYIMSLKTELKQNLIVTFQEPAGWAGAVNSDAKPEDQFHAVIGNALRMELDDFDKEWARFVRRTYPKK